MKDDRKCMCLEIMKAEFVSVPYKEVYIHLMGCPEDFTSKEYFAASWWKRLFMTHPRRYYADHLSVLSRP